LFIYRIICTLLAYVSIVRLYQLFLGAVLAIGDTTPGAFPGIGVVDRLPAAWALRRFITTDAIVAIVDGAVGDIVPVRIEQLAAIGASQSAFSCTCHRDLSVLLGVSIALAFHTVVCGDAAVMCLAVNP
jgi:hypothetical protein